MNRDVLVERMVKAIQEAAVACDHLPTFDDWEVQQATAAGGIPNAVCDDCAARAALRVVEEAQASKTLGDAVKVARQKWYDAHGGMDTVQVLYFQAQTRIAELERHLTEVMDQGQANYAAYEQEKAMVQALEAELAEERRVAAYWNRVS